MELQIGHDRINNIYVTITIFQNDHLKIMFNMLH
jgi:hypothetical protein